MPLEEVPTSTEAPPASDAVVAEAPTRAEHTRIDDDAGIVTFRGMGYSFDTLPDASKRRAGLIGLARLMRESDGDVWDKLKSGDFVVRVAAKPKELIPTSSSNALRLVYLSKRSVHSTGYSS